MERMTRMVDGKVVFPSELVGVMLTPDNVVLHKLLLRLAAYEDTGLTPAEVLSMYGEWNAMMSVLNSIGGYDRLRELVETDEEGRVAVLPCRVGQRVFSLLDTDKYISECEVKHIGLGNGLGFADIEPIGARGREYGVSLKGFGKTVFLTREEAEKTLEDRYFSQCQRCGASAKREHTKEDAVEAWNRRVDNG